MATASIPHESGLSDKLFKNNFSQPLKRLAYKKNYTYLCNAKTETRGLQQ